MKSSVRVRNQTSLRDLKGRLDSIKLSNKNLKITNKGCSNVQKQQDMTVTVKNDKTKETKEAKAIQECNDTTSSTSSKSRIEKNLINSLSNNFYGNLNFLNPSNKNIEYNQSTETNNIKRNIIKKNSITKSSFQSIINSNNLKNNKDKDNQGKTVININTSININISEQDAEKEKQKIKTDSNKVENINYSKLNDESNKLKNNFAKIKLNLNKLTKKKDNDNSSTNENKDNASSSVSVRTNSNFQESRESGNSVLNTDIKEKIKYIQIKTLKLKNQNEFDSVNNNPKNDSNVEINKYKFVVKRIKKSEEIYEDKVNNQLNNRIESDKAASAVNNKNIYKKELSSILSLDDSLINNKIHDSNSKSFYNRNNDRSNSIVRSQGDKSNTKSNDKSYDRSNTISQNRRKHNSLSLTSNSKYNY